MTIHKPRADKDALKAPFPWFGGKRNVAPLVWSRLGQPKHYIEPFAGSLALLLAAPKPASLEVVGDVNGYIANFWRAVVHQPDEVARWADYPVIHIDLGARHVWIVERGKTIGDDLQDPDWPGDAKLAGWWLWGQCAWIGNGWGRSPGRLPAAPPYTVGNAGHGIQARGKVPIITEPGRSITAVSARVEPSGEMHTSCGDTSLAWLRRIKSRTERVRVIHGDWMRTVNMHFGRLNGGTVALALDPPYLAFGDIYSQRGTVVARECEEWAREEGKHPRTRIALFGHVGDYDLPGWECVQWQRVRNTMGSTKTRNSEAIWFSPSCLKPEDDDAQIVL